MLEIFKENNNKYYNKSPLQNINNVKANFEIDKLTERRFPLSINTSCIAV